MSHVLRWEEPPPKSREDGGIRWAAIAEELRANPWCWAVVAVGTRAREISIAMEIKNGKLAAFRPAGSFDATTRSADNKVTVYARYVGES